jgi:hypothetical protein
MFLIFVKGMGAESNPESDHTLFWDEVPNRIYEVPKAETESHPHPLFLQENGRTLLEIPDSVSRSVS